MFIDYSSQYHICPSERSRRMQSIGAGFSPFTIKNIGVHGFSQNLNISGLLKNKMTIQKTFTVYNLKFEFKKTLSLLL